MLGEKKNIKFVNIKGNKEFQDENGEYIPRHEVKLDLSVSQKDRIVTEILDEKEAIDDEWDELGVTKNIEIRRRQYKGELVDSSFEEFFDVESGLTKDKCRSLTNRIYRTITSTDPLYSISARPGFSKEGESTTQAQEDFIDYAVDERLRFKPILKRAIHDSTIVPLSFIKFVFDIKTEKRKTKERFKSSPTWIVQTEDGVVSFNDIDEYNFFINKLGSIPYATKYTNPGLETYVDRFPESDNQANVEKLYEGKDIEVEVEYEEVIKSDPKPEFVKLENMRFRAYCDNYDDIASTKLIVETKEYTYFELKKLELENRFFDIDKMFENKDGERNSGYRKDKYEVLECTYFTDLDDEEETEEEVKCVFWIYEEKKLIIGAEHYSIDEVPCNYVPVKIVNEDNGLLSGASVAEDVASEDATITLIMRFMLEGWYFKNTITPITDNQEVVDDFIERRWTHGMPMRAKKGEIDFLGNHIDSPDLRGGLELMAASQKIAENKIGITSGMSGGADPVDPNAPATKTLALLNESKPDLISYIENLAPAINQCGYIILAMYAQLTEEDIPYRVSPARVTKNGGEFAKITKADLMAKTNIQTQAYAFAVDELMLKKELLAFYQLIRQEPLFVQDPESVNNLLRAIGKAWNPQIRNKIDEILPTNEALTMEKAKAAMQGVMNYVSLVMQNSKMTGVAPEFNPEQLVQIVSEHVKDIATPPQKEEMKQRGTRDERIVTQG